MKNKAEEIAEGMKPWFGKHWKYSESEIKAWNSAILAAGEFIRRFDDYDETRSLAMLELLIKNDKQLRAKAES